MKKIVETLTLIFFSFMLFSCNQNLTEEERKELHSKSMSKGDIIERSGTPMRAGSDPKDLKRQFDDAENRLRTGGGLFGKKPLDILGLVKNDNKNQTVAAVGLPINPYLWKGSLDTISFMPLLSADPFAGIIITDWYTDQNNTNQRCKLNIFIKGVELNTNNLKVNSFCQILSEKGNWIDQKIDNKNNILLENAILNKAKKIRLSQS
jgi:hypothetical protein